MQTFTQVQMHTSRRTPVRTLALAVAFAASMTSVTGCDLFGGDETAETKSGAAPQDAAAKDDLKTEPKVDVPAYAPEGDDAELKKEGADGITADNAVEKAKEIEATLDKAIEAAKAKDK